MKRAQSAVLRITSQEQPSTPSYGRKPTDLRVIPSQHGYSIFHRLFRRQGKGLATPAARLHKPRSPTFAFDSVQSPSPFVVGGKTLELDVFQSSTQLTNQSLSTTQLLQRKLLGSDTVAQISIQILERLFQQRCQDMRIRFIKEQFLRFLDKVYQQCQSGQLNLSGMALTSNCMQVICELVADGELNTLSLAQNEIFDTGIRQLSQKINSVQLVSLDVSNCGIGPHGFETLFGTLMSNNTIINLAIGNPVSNNRNRLGLHGCELLCKLITGNPYLQMLGLAGCGISTKMIGILNEGFKANSELKHLCLASNDFMALKNESVHIVQTVDWLEVQGNHIGDFGMVLIAEQLRPGGQALELSRLNIGDNKLTLSGLQGMLEHLERNAYLKQLILDNNSLVGDSSSNFISIFLSSNTCLTHLSLKNCSVNQHIAESIAQGLRHNTRLHYLNLSKNPISDAGALNLARAFAEAPLSLKSLKMKRCALNDEGAKPLFDSLIKQTNLQYLDFQSNLISDLAALFAVRALKQQPNLIQFKLRRNMISYHLQQEIERLIQFNLGLWQDKLIPGLRSQCAKISDYEHQQKIVNETHQRVTQKRMKVSSDIDQVQQELRKTQVQSVEKTAMVQDRLHRIKQEAASITKSCDTLDKHNWKELQQYDEQIAALKNDVKNENSQITQLTKQHQELQNKFKSLQSYFKQHSDQLKSHSEMLARKLKTAQAEYEGFDKQMDRLRSKEESTTPGQKRKTVVLNRNQKRESTMLQSPSPRKLKK